MASERPVTLKEIAAAAGVHFSTVSLALRNSPRLLPATRERVQAAARRLGYQPNPLVSALMAHRGRRRGEAVRLVIAYVTDFPRLFPERWLRNPSQEALRAGAAARAKELGFLLETFDMSAPGMSPRRLNDILYSRGIGGLIFGPRVDTHHRQLDFDWTHFSAVTLGVKVAEVRLDWVGSDYHFNMRLIFDHLGSLGYRRVGLVMVDEFSALHEGRILAAFELAQHTVPRSSRVRPLLVRETQNIPLRRHPALRPWVERERPDVIVTTIGPHGREWHELAATLPGRPGVVALSAQERDGRIAGVFQDNRHLGAMAVELVASMMQRNQTGFAAHRRCYLLEGEWIDGDSCPPRG